MINFILVTSKNGKDYMINVKNIDIITTTNEMPMGFIVGLNTDDTAHVTGEVFIYRDANEGKVRVTNLYQLMEELAK